MPNMTCPMRPWRVFVLSLLLLLPLLAAGCSDQAPEPKPAASLPEANATEANATAEAPVESNATEANATAEAPAENATQATAELAPAGDGAAPAACPPPAPAAPEKAPAKAGKSAAKEAPAKSGKAAAKDAPAKPAKAVADAAPDKAKKSAGPSGPMTLERAQDEFSSFARRWLATLSRNMVGNAAHASVTPEGGGYVARFAEVDQESMEVEVKPTDSPSCPFVGVLKYFECSYESRGDSPAAARSGTFSQVRKVRYTELFRHSGKRWE